MSHSPSAVNASARERLVNACSDDLSEPFPISFVPDGQSVTAALLNAGNKMGRVIGTVVVIAIDAVEDAIERVELKNN